jgi:integrase/recombinase XerD
MADTGRKRPAEILTEAEVRQLLARCSRRAPTGIRDRALLTVLYRTGLRVEEALALRPVDVDTEHGTVTVLHGKGDRRRAVGIDDGALAVVDLWKAERKRLGINGRATLFCTLSGGPLSANQVRQMVKRRAAKAGLEKRVHPHGLRHAYASEQSHEGVPVNEIRQMLGHSSLATTQVYLDGIAPAQIIARGRSRKWEP